MSAVRTTSSCPDCGCPRAWGRCFLCEREHREKLRSGKGLKAMQALRDRAMRREHARPHGHAIANVA